MALSSNDDQLVRVMGKTGVVIGRLSPKYGEDLLMRAISILRQREFVDLILPWMLHSIDKRLELPLRIRREMLNVLEDLIRTNDFEFDEVQASDINRICNILKLSIAS